MNQIAAFLGINLSCELPVTGYQIDSRLVRAGDLFFAIRGEKNDGHDFLGQVAKKGAVGAVVSKTYLGPNYGLILLPVDDVAASLRALAKASLEGDSLQIIGITGSVGKTMTKDFIATLIEGKYRIQKTWQSQNSKLTLPLAVLNRERGLDVLVLEMGMSDPGDIRRLIEIAPPDIAVLTHVALAHAASFPGGLAEIAQEKGTIFSHPKTKLAIFGPDFFEFPKEIAKIRCTKRVVSKSHLESASRFQEPHILHNIRLAICVASAVGMSDAEILERMPHLELPKMRFEQFKKNGIHFIQDAFNASPQSMRAALFSLGNLKTGGKRIAVLGTMKELGSFSVSEHAEMGRYAEKHVDHLLVLGEEAKPLFDAFYALKTSAEFFCDLEKIALRLKEIAKEGDAVLIKGSRSMNMETILDHL